MMKTLYYGCLIVFCGLCLLEAQAQKLKTVTVNLNSEEFEDLLPYHEYFFIKGKIKSDFAQVKVSIKHGGHNVSVSKPWRPEYAKQDEFLIKIPPLDPFKEYHFEFTVTQTAKTASISKTLTYETVTKDISMIHPKEKWLHETYAIKDSAGSEAAIENITIPQVKITPPIEDYIDVDIGFGMSPPDEIFGRSGISAFYSTVHLYFTPVNNNRPIRDMGFWQRFGPFAGLTLKTVTEPSNFESLFSSLDIIAGISFKGPFTFLPYRGWDGLRLNIGGILFEQVDGNPLVEKKRTKVDWFIGLSVPFDLSRILGPAVGALGLR